jgi:hypothetical protein
MCDVLWTELQQGRFRFLQPSIPPVASHSSSSIIRGWYSRPVFPLVFGPPLWSSGQSSWLYIKRSGCDSRRYHIFWEVVGLERGPLSLVSTIEELLGRKSSGSGLENREYGRRDSSRWSRGTPLSTKVDTNFAGNRVLAQSLHCLDLSPCDFYFFQILRIVNWFVIEIRKIKINLEGLGLFFFPSCSSECNIIYGNYICP